MKKGDDLVVLLAEASFQKSLLIERKITYTKMAKKYLT